MNRINDPIEADAPGSREGLFGRLALKRSWTWWRRQWPSTPLHVGTAYMVDGMLWAYAVVVLELDGIGAEFAVVAGCAAVFLAIARAIEANC